MFHTVHSHKEIAAVGMEHGAKEEIQQSILTSIQPPPPAVSHSSSVLENLLSDTDSPPLKRYREATWIELKLLFKLSAPAVMMYLVNNAMSVSTRIFSGQLGNLQFAAACLGNQGIQLFAYGLLVCSSPLSQIFLV